MYKSVFKSLYNKVIDGRNGIDDLIKFQFYFLIILFILDIFVDSYTVGLLQLISMISIGYRFMSRNLYKRVKRVLENNFLQKHIRGGNATKMLYKNIKKNTRKNT